MIKTIYKGRPVFLDGDFNTEYKPGVRCSIYGGGHEAEYYDVTKGKYLDGDLEELTKGECDDLTDNHQDTLYTEGLIERDNKRKAALYSGAVQAKIIEILAKSE